MLALLLEFFPIPRSLATTRASDTFFAAASTAYAQAALELGINC
jgi:hypothetical protein